MMILNKFLPKKIWQQILLIILTVGAIPMTVLGISLINTSYKTMEQIICHDLDQISRSAAGKVQKEFEGVWHVLDLAASIIGTLDADRWRQETVLIDLTLKFPSILNLCSFDLNGNPIACSNLDSGLVMSIDPNMLQCLKTKEYCISDVRFSKEHLPVMDIAVPVNHLGKMTSIIKGEYNLRGIWNTVDQIQPGLQGRAILINEQGYVLAHSDKKEVFKNEKFSNSEIIEDIQNGRSMTRMFQDDQNQRWVSAYAPLGDLSWGLILLQPNQEAFILARMMGNHSKILILFGLFMTGLVGFLITRRLSLIVNEIILATRKVAKGDLSVSLPVRRNDEINRMHFAFNHMTNRLKKAQEMERLSIVGKSAASIAHELKNSLVLVKSFIQMIPLRHHDKAFVKEATETIVGELDGWNEMLRNIMDFSRDQDSLNFKPINLNAIIEDMMLLLKLKAQELNIVLEVETKNVIPLIQADELKIKQVLLNLVTNAFEATKVGGRICVSSFTSKQPGGDIAGVEVFNSGSQISQESLNEIFTPFFTTKDQGLGLGLAISRDIVHRHGGRLEVENLKNIGVVFRVMLPIYRNEIQKRKAYDFREDRRSG